MVRSIKVVSAFVASPSDVDAERKALSRIVEEINLTTGSLIGLQLEIVKWETHTHPSVGVDAQAVINEQIGSDFDIFIGILWSRVGTATGRAVSGTIEEFERAYERLQSNPGSVEIMMYFKDEPLAPSQIDPEQFVKLNDFKTRIKSLGVLYRPFSNTNEFEHQARIHLNRLLSEYAKSGETDVSRLSTIQSASRAAQDKNVDLNDPDIGYLDLEEEFAEACQKVNKGTEDIAAATVQFGKAIREQTGKLSSTQSIAARKSVVDDVAALSDKYAEFLEHQLPELRDAQQRMSISGARRITLFATPQEAGSAEVKGLIDVVEGLMTSYRTACDQISGMRNTTASVPRITASMNKATRRLVRALDDLLDSYSRGEKLLGAIRDAAADISARKS